MYCVNATERVIFTKSFILLLNIMYHDLLLFTTMGVTNKLVLIDILYFYLLTKIKIEKYSKVPSKL